MASCVRNIRMKNYQNLIISFEVTVENVGMLFGDTVYVKCVNYRWVQYNVKQS